MAAKSWILLAVVLAGFPLAAGVSAKRLSAPQATFQDSIGEAIPVASRRGKGNPVAFQDSSGDAPAWGDIATVKVLSYEAQGTFTTFQIIFVGRVGTDATVVVYLDTDRRAATGAPTLFGAEYALFVNPKGKCCPSTPTWTVRRWNWTTFRVVSSSEAFGLQKPRLDVDLDSARVLWFSFRRAELGSSGFNFAVATKSRSRPARTLDRVPDQGRAPSSFDPTVTGRASADIATVVVSREDSEVMFDVLFADRIPSRSSVVAYLDTDRTARTGVPVFGADYAFEVSNLRQHPGPNLTFNYSLGRWDGTRFKPVYRTHGNMYGFPPGFLSFRVGILDLGMPTGFNFAVATKSSGQPAHILDRAPNPGRAPWSFKIPG